MDENEMLVPRARTALQQAAMRLTLKAVEMLEMNKLSKHAKIVLVLQGGQITAHITDTAIDTIVLKSE